MISENIYCDPYIIIHIFSAAVTLCETNEGAQKKENFKSHYLIAVSKAENYLSSGMPLHHEFY
jgi:hypothetical protein